MSAYIPPAEEVEKRLVSAINIVFHLLAIKSYVFWFRFEDERNQYNTTASADFQHDENVKMQQLKMFSLNATLEWSYVYVNNGINKFTKTFVHLTDQKLEFFSHGKFNNKFMYLPYLMTNQMLYIVTYQHYRNDTTPGNESCLNISLPNRNFPQR